MSAPWPHKAGWATPKAQLQIAKKLNQGNVAIVLGAGISFFYGLPSWSGLLSGLQFNGVGHAIAEMGDYPLWAQQILDDLFGGDEKAFNAAVHNSLYGPEADGLEMRKIYEDRGLRAIGTIGIGGNRGAVDTIVTFNYDSLLESYFAQNGLNVNPIISENQPTLKADVAIYHPHGFLPHPEAGLDTSNQIVLSKMQYDRTIETPWESTLENLFATRFCIFIGLSGNDERLLGVLDRVNRRSEHAQVENYWGYRICRKPDENVGLWDERGVYSVECDDLSVGIEEILLNICRLAAKVS